MIEKLEPDRHSPVLHSRQFLLGPRPRYVGSDWQLVEPWPGRVLSFASDLPIQIIRDSDNGVWVLVGWAYQSEETLNTPALEIQNSKTSRVPGLRTTWSGRWALIGEKDLFPDACGFLPIFYRKLPNSEFWVSSSVALLDELSPHASQDIDSRRLNMSRGVYWFPPPSTRYRSINQLLPSQLLDTQRCAPAPIELLEPVAETSYEVLLDQVAHSMISVLKGISKDFPRVWIAVSAGHDSRVVLAAAVAGKVSVSTYTQTFDIMPIADRQYAPLIAAAAGYSHRFIDPKAQYTRVVNLADKHSGLQAPVAIDRQFLAAGQWDFCNSRDVVLRGGGFEIGRCYYYPNYFACGSELPSAQELVGGLGEPSDSSAQVGFNAWRTWVLDNPLATKMDWRDRVCMEQTYGGWFAAVEQLLTLAPPVSINPVNCTRTYSRILRMPEKYRATTQHQKDLVARIAPKLAEFPFVQSNVEPD